MSAFGRPSGMSFGFRVERQTWGLSPSLSPEPLKASDCPHKPGTPEHSAWIHENVVERQSNPYTAANHNERDRIDRLIHERAERLNTTWAQRSRALDEMIADLPVPGVPLPPDFPCLEMAIRGGVVRFTGTIGIEFRAERTPWQPEP